ncbi:MAG: LIC12192 family sporadic carbohydrate cluster protein [Candidatus Binatia bacterium]
MTKIRRGYRGYVTCREFGGLRISVPVQALIMRDYCDRNGLMYKLHVNENVFPHSYVVLEGLLNELDIYEGILATSMFMLPQRAARRRRIYERVLDQDASLHLVLEDFVIATPEDIDPVEEILTISALLPEAPRTIPPGTPVALPE